MLEKKLVLLLGGARSGKSAFAEAMAREHGGRVLFVATAQAGDAEMSERIAAHRASRPSSWETLEEPLNLARQLSRVVDDFDLVLVDCITVWISNMLLAVEGENDSDSEIARLLEDVDALIEVHRRSSASFVLIANEVGLGLVPPYPLGRLYRDALGRTNQALARAADEVYFLIAGILVPIKKG